MLRSGIFIADKTLFPDNWTSRQIENVVKVAFVQNKRIPVIDRRRILMHMAIPMQYLKQKIKLEYKASPPKYEVTTVYPYDAKK